MRQYWLRSAFVFAVTGCASGAPSATPMTIPVPAERVDSTAWRADARYLMQEIMSRHPDPFLRVSRAQLEREADMLDRDIPRLADWEVVYRLKKLVAQIGDGHTGGPFIVTGDRRLPLRFEWFEATGIVLTASDSTRRPLVGRRLLRIGKLTAEEAFDSLSRLDASDNAWGQRSRVPRYFSSVTALAAVGAVTNGAPVLMIFSGPRGDSAVTLAWPNAVARVGTVANPQRPPALPFGWHYVPAHSAVVVRYDQCDRGREFALMTDTILRFVDSARVKRVIVDVRANPGGSTRVAAPLVAGLERRSARLAGNVYVLIGRDTYSSAMDFAIEMRRRVRAVLAGEPTGGTPNGNGEVKQIILPNSLLAFQVSTRFYGNDPTGLHTVMPDVHIARSIDGFLDHRDELLEAVLRRE